MNLFTKRCHPAKSCYNSTMLKQVCVFCGSSPGIKQEYLQAARQLGTLLAQNNLALVYGAGSTGLMGETANAVLAAGGRVIGITPEMFMNRGLIHEYLTEIHVVESMHERKILMHTLADAYIVLPGGYGTLDELFETVAWAQLGIHRKPCGILNVCGFYDRLADFLNQVTDAQFITPVHRAMLIIEKDPAILLEKLAGYTPPRENKQPLDGA